MNKYKTMLYMVVIALLEILLVLSLAFYEQRQRKGDNTFFDGIISSKKSEKINEETQGKKKNKVEEVIDENAKDDKKNDTKDIEIIEEEVPMEASPLDIVSLDEKLEDSLIVGDSRIISMYNRLNCESGTFAFDAALTSKDLKNKKLLGNKKDRKTAYGFVQNKNKYKKIYIAVGLNDVEKTKINEFYKNMKNYVSYTKKYQKSTIYICSIIYVASEKSGKDNEKNLMIDKYNKQLKQISIEHKTKYIDMNKILKTKNNTLKKLYAIDGINLNTDGCSMMGSIIASSK